MNVNRHEEEETMQTGSLTGSTFIYLFDKLTIVNMVKPFKPYWSIYQNPNFFIFCTLKAICI